MGNSINAFNTYTLGNDIKPKNPQMNAMKPKSFEPVFVGEPLDNKSADKEIQTLFDSNMALIGMTVKNKEIQNKLFKLNSIVYNTDFNAFSDKKILLLNKIQNTAVNERAIEDRDDKMSTGLVNAQMEYCLELAQKLKEDGPEHLNHTKLEELQRSLDYTLSYQKSANYSQLADDGAHAFRDDVSQDLLKGMKTTQDYKYVAKDIETESSINPLVYLTRKMRHGEKQDYIDEVRYKPLKNFLQLNQKISSMTNQMYEEFYSSKQEKEIQTALDRINSEFNVKVFLSESGSTSKKESLEKIQKELEEWKKAGGNEVKFPPILDLNKMDENMLFSTTMGYSYFYGDKSLKNNIRLNTGDSIEHYLRHEMTHNNDNKHLDKSWKPELKYVKKFLQEFKDAGIRDDFALSYCLTNRAEFIAVAAMGDMSKYSAELKKLLVEQGMPEWMLKLPASEPMKMPRL